nr:hypothetical protein [Tanacetum cinerariifolium]
MNRAYPRAVRNRVNHSSIKKFDNLFLDYLMNFWVNPSLTLHCSVLISLEDHDLSFQQVVSELVSKIPVLDIGKFEQWQFRMQQYLQHEHYTLWEVIEFRDSYEVPVNDPSTTTTNTTSGEADTNKYKTARELWAAILKTFSGNEATKKTKKNLLKQQYGNFRAEGSETLEQTFTRLQVIVGQLQFMDVEVEQDDLNQKFLTSLAPKWLMHTIVWRNRSVLDTMSLDDLYNHLKVYETEVQKKTEPNTQNMAFISLAKHSRGNDEVNTDSVYTASSNVSTASVNVATIDEDDMEEIDIKWNMALLSMRADKFWKKTEKKISIQGSDVAEFDKSKVECFNSHKMGHFARECIAPKNQDRGRRDNYRQGSKAEEQAPKALMAIDRVGWDWSYMANDEEDHALVADEETPDIKWNMALLSMRADKFWKKTEKKISIQGSDVAEFDKSKVECFNSHKMGHFARECIAPKNQDRGRRDNYRQGSKAEEQAPKALMAIDRVGWDWSYMANDEEDHALVADEETPTEFALMANTSTESKRSDKSKEGLGYTVVPLPPAQLYFSPNKDLSWTGLPECADDTITDYSRPSPTVESSSEEDQNRNPSVSEKVASPIIPKPFVKFVKASDSQSKSKIDEKETPKKPPVKYTEQYRKPNKKPNVRRNQRNWNNLKSHQLGPDFIMKKKACFNCGDFNHLAYECRKRVKRGTTRFQNNTYKVPSHRPVVHRPNRSPMRSMRPNMNCACSNITSFNKSAHSYTNRHFQRKSIVKSQNRASWIPTVNRNFLPVNRKFSTGSRNFPTGNKKFSTASRKFPIGSTKNPTGDMGLKGKAVKPSALLDLETFTEPI